jgi:hypothetical protein
VRDPAASRRRDEGRVTAAWNFERRHLTCARFLVGVSLIAEGRANHDTSLEAVRHRMRLPPEDALFAARRLGDEELIAFEPGGSVRSTAKGVERAAALLRDASATTREFDVMARTLRGGGIPLGMLKIALHAAGGLHPCGAPASDDGATYRVALVDDQVAVQRRRDDGTYEPVPLDPEAR